MGKKKMEPNVGDTILKSIKLVLPYPPSVNKYYGQNMKTGIRYIGKAGKKHRLDTQAIALGYFSTYGILPSDVPYFKKGEYLHCMLNIDPPDNRKRDSDNLLKCFMDSLQYADIIEDDFYIETYNIHRNRKPNKTGLIEMTLWQVK